MSSEPIRDDREYHPAWGLIGASRVQSGPPGAALFDSDLRHQHYVVISLQAARRDRHLHQDRLSGNQQIIQIAMSEAQWASFVSSMNVGNGVPCTIERRDGVVVPDVPYEPRLHHSMRETRDAADRALDQITAAFAAYKERKNATNLRQLEYAIKNAPANIEFAAQSLSEHAENVVQKARADIEAMVLAKAHQLEVEHGDLIAAASTNIPARLD